MINFNELMLFVTDLEYSDNIKKLSHYVYSYPYIYIFKVIAKINTN